MLSHVLFIINAKWHFAGCRFAECRYAECRFAECRYAECRGAKSRAGTNLVRSSMATGVFSSELLNIKAGILNPMS